MGTIAQNFWLSQDAKDFAASGEVDIRKLSPSTQAQVQTTVCSHPNAAGTTSITLDPYSTSSTQSDIRASAGWAINRLGADGMDSAATSRRLIPAGTWNIGLQVNLPQAGTATGTLTVTLVLGIYRVSSSGARTLIFTSDLPVTGSSNGLSIGGVTAQIGGSVTVPQIILEANETIHVGLVSRMVQAAGLLGATVAGSATYVTGGDATSADVVLPSPGVRTQYTQTQDPAVGKGVSTRSILVRKDTESAVGVGVGAYDYLAEFFRAFNASGKGEADRELLTVLKFVQAVGKGVGARSNLVRKDLISAIGKGAGARAALVRKNTLPAIGEGAGIIDKVATYVRLFEAFGKGVPTEDEVVIFVRSFLSTGNGVVRPRIALDWEDLPEAGGGTTVIIRRTTLINDD